MGRWYVDMPGFLTNVPDTRLTNDGIENLPGQFAVWAASPEARFLHGRFVWAKWDVDELRGGPLRKRIDEDDEFLKVGVNGIQEWEKAGKTA